MPIKGFTDQGFVSFPKIGDIRKGAEKEPNKPGADLTYFRAVFPEDEGGAAATFARVYGDEPREVNVLLPFDEIERCWETWQEEHTAGALQHRCDGETCVMWRGEDGEMQFTPKPCPGGCVPQGRLKVIVPELRRLAYLVVHTTSVWDIHEITANLNALKGLTRNGIKGIPLVLKRRPRKISTPWRQISNGSSNSSGQWPGRHFPPLLNRMRMLKPYCWRTVGFYAATTKWISSPARSSARIGTRCRARTKRNRSTNTPSGSTKRWPTRWTAAGDSGSSPT